MKKIGISIVILFFMVLVFTYVKIIHLPHYNKKVALLRLEDVSLGGNYQTLDDLGKLRAVFDYLLSENIPFSVSVIPKSIEIEQDGTKSVNSIDDNVPNDLNTKYIALLKSIDRSGATIGMHGYTHQYGDKWEEDSSQNSGIGNEFHIDKAEETSSKAYAEDRIEKSIKAFQKIGIEPHYWESPHYHDTRAQQEVFRSYIGLLYQPDKRSINTLFDTSYYDRENSGTLGSVYIPTPLQYVKGEDPVGTVNSKLKAVKWYRGLASLYFHPFLEFPYLEAVKKSDGFSLMKDGIPVYNYRNQHNSSLHMLINRLKQKGYRWSSLHEVVPFTPAHRIVIPHHASLASLSVGNVDGKQGDEVIWRQGNSIMVLSDQYKLPRNRKQAKAVRWLSYETSKFDSVLLIDWNGDGKKDFVTYNKKSGTAKIYYSLGDHFQRTPLELTLPKNISYLKTANINGNGEEEIIFQYQNQLFRVGNTSAKPVRIMEMKDTPLIGDWNGDGLSDFASYSNKKSSITVFLKGKRIIYSPRKLNDSMKMLVSDTNGDGISEFILYNQTKGIWYQYQIAKSQSISLIESQYGPWGKGKNNIYTGDFDGNGKEDMAILDIHKHVMDLSLSFQP